MCIERVWFCTPAQAALIMMVNKVTLNFCLARRQQEMVTRRRKRRRKKKKVAYFLCEIRAIVEVPFCTVLVWGRTTPSLSPIRRLLPLALSPPLSWKLTFFFFGFPSCSCLLLSCDALLQTASCLHCGRTNIVPAWRQRHFTGYRIFSMGPISL